MRRYIGRRFKVLSIVAALSLMGVVWGFQASVSAVQVVPGGVSGGGYQSAVALTNNGATIFSGGDISGIHKSTNSGRTFSTKNLGVGSKKVAAIAATSDNEEILYAGFGNHGTTGGLFRSVDGGDSWAMTAAGSNAKFAGNHSVNSDPLPTGHPRSNGHLIDVVEGGNARTHTDDVVLAGTYKNGVKIFTNGGNTLAATVASGGFVRGVAADPSNSSVAYAAVYFSNSRLNGIYKINLANPSSASANLVYRTSNPEEVAVLPNGHVYAAIGPNGIAANTGSGWSVKSAGLTKNNTHVWAGVDGFVSGGSDVVYATVNNSTGSSSHSSVWRSTNSAGSWAPLVTNSNVSTTSPNGASWWYEKGFGGAILGERQTSFSQVSVIKGSSRSADVIVVSGRGGLWRSDNGGGNWYPAVTGMLVTSNREIAFNPNDRDQVVVGNTDYVVLESSNGLQSIERDKPQGADSRSYDIMFDGRANQVLAATGDRDGNKRGEIFTKSAADLGSPSDRGWTNLGLSSKVGGKIPQSVAVGYPNGNRVILAGVKGGGVWRLSNGTWSATSGGPDLFVGGTASVRGEIVWPDPAGRTVYLLDAADGLWRSKNAGASWTNMWSGLKLKNSNSVYNTTYMTSDDPDVLYLSLQGSGSGDLGRAFKLLRIDNASTATINGLNDSDVTDMTPAGVKKVGPVDVDEQGRLFLAVPSNENDTHAGLWQFDNPSRSTVGRDISTSNYRSTVVTPTGIDVDSVNGIAYIAQRGIGAIAVEIEPSTTPPRPTTTTSTTTTTAPTTTEGPEEETTTTTEGPEEETTTTTEGPEPKETTTTDDVIVVPPTTEGPKTTDTTVPPSDQKPVVSFSSLEDGDTIPTRIPYGGVNVVTYDPDAGSADGDGIRWVTLVLSDAETGRFIGVRREYRSTYDWALKLRSGRSYVLTAYSISTSEAGGGWSKTSITVTAE